MKYLVTGKEMQLLDLYTSEHFHVPSVVLMEQAAGIFVQKLLSLYPNLKKLLVVCGLGNNGADGLAIARLLNQRGIQAVIFDLQTVFPEKRGSELFALQKDICRQYHYPFANTIGKEDYDLVVDAVFGIGLSRDITGPYQEIIQKMNELSIPIVAVDIASGVDADQGRICGSAAKAAHTITFSFGKTGQFLWPGNEYSGEIHIMPIGIRADGEHGCTLFSALEETDLPLLLPKRKAHSNKGNYGKILIIAGSPGMSGAAYFAAKAAYRTGAGLVRILTHESNRTILQQLIPEAIVSVYQEEADVADITDQIVWANAIVIGPGLGTSACAEALLKQVLKQKEKPVVADADALNLLAVHKEWLEKKECQLIITPHMGEMSRLSGLSIGTIQSKLIETATSFAEQYRLICVLKDFRTIISSWKNQVYVNLSGNHGMATGGSGDVLSGITGTLAAQMQDLLQAAAAAAYLHGAAGDTIAEEVGYRSLMAGDLIEGISLCTKDF